VYVTALSRDDLSMIMTSLHPRINEGLSSLMIEFVDCICRRIDASEFGSVGGPWEFNLRDVLRWAELMESVAPGDEMIADPLIAAQFLDMVFVQRMRIEQDRDLMKKMFEETFGFYPAENDLNRKILVETESVTVGRVSLSRNQDSMVETSSLQILQKSSRVLESLILGVNMNWMVLLTGSSASGKTSLVRLLASLAGRDLKEFAMNEGVDTVELLGGFEQADISRRREQIIEEVKELSRRIIRHLFSFRIEKGIVDEVEWITGCVSSVSGKIDDEFEEFVLCLLDRILHVSSRVGLDFVLEKVESLRALMENWKRMKVHGVNGSFEWIDGTLVKALEQGHWVLIDNVNFCSPSVLDRLNPLMEPGGCLMINERGLVNGEMKVIRPHPDFRLFLTMDPRHGEISRAMRNRGVELSMLGSECLPGPGGAGNLSDVSRMLNCVGLAGAKLPEIVFDLHRLMEEWGAECGRCGIVVVDVIDQYSLIRSAKLIVERLQRGEGLVEAVGNSMQDIYSIEKGCFGLDLDMYDEEISSRLESIRERIADTLELLKNDDALRLVQPSIWPVPIDGAMRLGNSELANVCLQASMMEAMIYEEGCDTVMVDSVLKSLLKGMDIESSKLLVSLLEYRVSQTIPNARVDEGFKRAIQLIGGWTYVVVDVVDSDGKIVCFAFLIFRFMMKWMYVYD
jgi:midasin